MGLVISLLRGGYGFGYDEAKGKLASPLMAVPQPKDDEYFTEVESIWDLPRLYADLTAIGWVLTTTQKRYLRGVLAGFTVKEIGRELRMAEGTVKVALSSKIYPAIRALTGQSNVDSRSLPSLLHECGYKYSTSKELTSPVGSPKGDTSVITSSQESITTEDENNDEIPSWLKYQYIDGRLQRTDADGSFDLVKWVGNEFPNDPRKPRIPVSGKSASPLYRLLEAFREAIREVGKDRSKGRRFYVSFDIDMKDVNIPPPPNIRIQVSEDLIDLNEIELYPERTKAILIEHLLSKVIPECFQSPEHWNPDPPNPASREEWLKMLVRRFPFMFLFKNCQVISKGNLITIKSFLNSTLEGSISKVVFIEK